ISDVNCLKPDLLGPPIMQHLDRIAIRDTHHAAGEVGEGRGDEQTTSLSAGCPCAYHYALVQPPGYTLPNTLPHRHPSATRSPTKREPSPQAYRTSYAPAAPCQLEPSTDGPPFLESRSEE